MACGCKNKQTQAQAQTQSASPQNTTSNVQEAIKKTVEKYYNKK